MSEAVAVPAVAETAASPVANETSKPSEKKEEPAEQDQPPASVDHPEVSADLESQDVDAELEEMKKRLAQMEAESAVASTNQGSTPSDANTPAAPGHGPAAATGSEPAVGGAPAPNSQMPPNQDSISDIDARSVYVGNVDYAATGDQLSEHFADCGTINRVTIMCNKNTGMPKGFAYIEFEDLNAAQNALILNESPFLGRPLKVVAKRTNIPIAYRGGYRGRGRFNRGGRGYPRRGRRSWRGRWTPY